MKRCLRFLLMADAWSILALGMIGPIYALFVAQIGGDLLDASWAYFAFMFTSGILIFLIGKWEDRVKHKERLIVFGYSLTAVGCLMYYFVYSQTMLILTQIVLGVAEAFLIPAFDAVYSAYLDKGKEASEWGFEESMFYIVTAISALLGGYIANIFGFRVLFIIMFCASLLSVFYSMNLFRKKRANSRS